MALNNLDRVADPLPHILASGGGGGGASVAIGSPVTGGTDGNILFIGAGGLLAQDANLFWDDTDNQLVLGAGTVTKPSLIFGDDGTGLWRPALDVIGIARAGVDVLRIGGTGPDSDQTMAMGRFLFDSRTTDRGIISHRDMTSTTQFGLSMTATGGTIINSASGQNCGMATGGSTRWYVDGTSFSWIPGIDNGVGADLGTTTNRIRRIFMGEYFEMSEMTAPAAPAANKVRLYSDDSGGGKTRIMALFPTGAAQQVAIEP